ncbi:MAG: ABC transporter permease [Thermoleophilia bacterium]|nr:ABC transporter permease [Thermoleophilia bacterium]
MNSLLAQLLLVRKRKAYWTLLGFWIVLPMLFSYLLPYFAFTSDSNFRPRGLDKVLLTELLPQNFVNNILASFPFFGGTIALIIGVLFVGSEYSWGTLTYAFTQKASRLKVFGGKMAALGIVLIPFVVLVFMFAFLASLLIAMREGQAVELPPLLLTMKALGACWLIMAAWSSVGVMIAVLSRGTALAIGLGIIYALVIENFITVFGRQIEALSTLSQFLVRTSGYSLIYSLGATVQSAAGPGSFFGEYLSVARSCAMLGGFVAVALAISAAVIRWRDVVGNS